MTINLEIHWLKKLSAIVTLAVLILIFIPTTHALSGADQVKNGMRARQEDARLNYELLHQRITTNMDKLDPKYDRAKELLDEVEDKKNSFVDLNVDAHYCNKDRAEDPGDTDCSKGNLRPDAVFLSKENALIDKQNALNRYLIQPVQPGSKTYSNVTKTGGVTEEGTVPTGDIFGTDDQGGFIPQIIRLLIRFASLGVFVSFVVSGVMFVLAFGNEERVTKAKQMLYYTLVGFAFVALAFAIVKAVTSIDFFGFI